MQNRFFLTLKGANNKIKVYYYVRFVLTLLTPYLFVGVKLLLFKTEALNLIKVLSSFERNYIVSADASYPTIGGICRCVKC